MEALVPPFLPLGRQRCRGALGSFVAQERAAASWRDQSHHSGRGVEEPWALLSLSRTRGAHVDTGSKTLSQDTAHRAPSPAHGQGWGD